MQEVKIRIDKILNIIDMVEDVKFTGPQFFCPFCKRLHYFNSGWGRDCGAKMRKRGLTPVPYTEEGGEGSAEAVQAQLSNFQEATKRGYIPSGMTEVRKGYMRYVEGKGWQSVPPRVITEKAVKTEERQKTMKEKAKRRHLRTHKGKKIRWNIETRVGWIEGGVIPIDELTWEYVQNKGEMEVIAKHPVSGRGVGSASFKVRKRYNIHTGKYENILYLSMLSVDYDFRGRGATRTMMASIIKFIDTNNITVKGWALPIDRYHETIPAHLTPEEREEYRQKTLRDLVRMYESFGAHKVARHGEGWEMERTPHPERWGVKSTDFDEEMELIDIDLNSVYEIDGNFYYINEQTLMVYKIEFPPEEIEEAPVKIDFTAEYIGNVYQMTHDYPVSGYERTSSKGKKHSVSQYERGEYPGKSIHITKSGQRYIEFAKGRDIKGGTEKAIRVGTNIWIPRSVSFIKGEHPDYRKLFVKESWYPKAMENARTSSVRNLESQIEEVKKNIIQAENDLKNPDPFSSAKPENIRNYIRQEQESLKKLEERLKFTRQVKIDTLVKDSENYDMIEISEFNKLSTDFTNDFTVYHGPITREGPFEYYKNGKKVTLYKQWDNIVDRFGELDYIPLKAKRGTGSHFAEILGFATNWEPEKEPKEGHKYKQMYADVILLNDIYEHPEAIDLKKYQVSIGFEDEIEGNKQFIKKVDHLAMSDIELGRCSTGAPNEECFVQKINKNHNQNLNEV